MKQYETKSNDNFIERYRNQVQIVCLAGAGNLFEHYEAIGQDNPTADEKK